MPDFDVKTPAVNPTAFADVIQRKQQIEFAQRQAEQERKDSRVTRLLQAVQSGQAIASNMITLAEKRKQLQGERELASLMKEPTTLPDTDPLKAQMEPAFQEDRKKRLMNAIAKADPKGLTTAMLKQNFASNKPASAGQMSIEKISVPRIGQMVVNVDKLNRKVYNLAGTDITDQVGDAIPAFAPAVIDTGSGNVNFVERNVPGKAGATTTNAPIDPKDYGKVEDLRQLEKNDRSKVFELIDKGSNDKIITEGRAALKPLQLMRKAINEDNKAVIDRMGGLFHKAVTADVGNLATYEQRDPSSRAIFDRIKNAGSMWVKGVPADSVRKEMLDALDSAEEVIKSTAGDAIEYKTEAITEQFPQLNKDAIKRKMGSEFFKGKKKSAQDEADEFMKGFTNK